MCFLWIVACLQMQGEDKKGRSLWQHPWLSSWLVSESPTCLATQSLKIETALYVFFKRACRCLFSHRPAGTHVYAAKTTVQSTERIWSRFGIQISFPRSELNHYPTNKQTIKLALLLSTMAEVQGTILRRGALHLEPHSTPTHILITWDNFSLVWH